MSKFHSAYDYNLNIKDVPGATAGSLKKGIVTTRTTNPVNPDYKYIGDVELSKTNPNNPYGRIDKATIEKAKTPQTVQINPQETRRLPLSQGSQINNSNQKQDDVTSQRDARVTPGLER